MCIYICHVRVCITTSRCVNRDKERQLWGGMGLVFFFFFVFLKGTIYYKIRDRIIASKSFKKYKFYYINHVDEMKLEIYAKKIQTRIN